VSGIEGLRGSGSCSSWYSCRCDSGVEVWCLANGDDGALPGSDGLKVVFVG